MTGEPPFRNRQLEAMILLAIMTDDIPTPEEYPELPATDPLWDIMRECWKEEPTERPTMVDVLDKVRNFGFNSILTVIHP